MNRTLAHIFSTVGHPLLVPTYVLLLLMAVNPQQFGSNSIGGKRPVLLLISVFVTTCVLPALGVALMKPLGFIKSLRMEDKQERIGPYIMAGVFYLWLYKNLASGSEAPPLFITFVLASAIGLFFNFFANIFFKISAHAAGMGGFAAMLLLTLNQPGWAKYGLEITVFGGALQLSLAAVAALGILLAGAVGTSRLALGAHVPSELYRGYASGALAVLIASMI